MLSRWYYDIKPTVRGDNVVVLMIDGENLVTARSRAGLTQEQVAMHLGVPRELVSMWENGVRVPTADQTERLARLYHVSTGYLTGEEGLERDRGRRILWRGGSGDGQASQVRRREIAEWTAFLDRWAEFLISIDGQDPEQFRPGRPPRSLDSPVPITDARRAPTLAARVREEYGLGEYAIPNLYSFFDDVGVLVYRCRELDELTSEGETISGAFYNHPQVGFSIFVNANCSPGRQAFTLAHEFARVLFHYHHIGMVTMFEKSDPDDRLANAFAANFLVPGKTLRRMAKNVQRRMDLTPCWAISFASCFRVSYPMMLHRLVDEGLIAREQGVEWSHYSAAGIAHVLGLESAFEEHRSSGRPRKSVRSKFSKSARTFLKDLRRYPGSVIERARWALAMNRASGEKIKELLAIDAPVDTVTKGLQTLPRAESWEARGLDEFPRAGE